MPRITPVLFTYPFPPPGQHFPSSVQVTGTFDDWQRTTEPLTKNDREQRFEAEIQVDLERLPQIDDPCSSSYERRAEAELDPREVSQQKRKLVYKFILDGNNWLTDPTQPNERDYEGNLNNIWFLEDRTASERLELERQEAEQQRAKEVEDDVITQKLGGGGGLSGTPNLAANDLTTPPSDLTGNHQHPHDHESSNSTGDGGGGEMTHSATTKTLVNPSTTGAFTAGDAKPLQDGSIKTTMAPTEQAPHSPSRSTGDEHDGDGDYGVAILQGDPVTISPLQRTPSTEGAAGDAHPTVDASIAEAGNAPLSINTATTNASASASEQSLASSMSSHPTSSSHAKAPTSPSRSNSNSKSATPKLYGEEAINDNGAVKSAVPTTAVSTTTPQFPSTSSLAVQSNKTGGKKSMWKRFKKVFS
ncbi:hypothetical protein BGZ68_005986 [Mortierella alpina]|nr:hypothetical protein BGZ68_005986 [Mortierella alpina]